VAQAFATMGSATPEAVGIVAGVLRQRAGAVVSPRESLEVVGTGYRVQAKGNNVEFALGYSHPITVEPPAGISFLRDRSPVTPKMMRVLGPAIRFSRRSVGSRSGLCSGVIATGDMSR
ncbi:50S ribosomal protein L6, partial [Bacillus sp. S34]|nr:50S ribosomal protein L6 [Bacillus sp. S34]